MPDELDNLYGDMESDRVERKRSLHADRVSQAICAYSNDLPNYLRPGYVLVGVEDDGACSNTIIDDALMLNLAHLRDRGLILPIPIMHVERREIDGCVFAAVTVQPHPTPPVRYDGRTWIRVGPRRAIATIDEERVLTEKRRWGTLSFDQQPVVTASAVDLNEEAVVSYISQAVAPEILRQNGRSTAEQLMSLRFLSQSHEPNLAAVLVFCDDPRRFAPGAYVQFVRYDGNDVFAPIADEKVIDGPLVQMLTELDDLVRLNIRSLVTFRESDREMARPDYPLVALQQLLRNALMHRSYEHTNAPVRLYWFADRIEIHNPGGFYGGVTLANIGDPGITDYRNPLLAEAMKVLGYVQRFGIGVATARRELTENGNPALEYQASESAIVAIVRRS